MTREVIWFFEYVRLLKEVKPKYFLLENVKMKKEHQDIITRHVGIEPVRINSSLVSGALRNRLYWTNIPNVTLPKNRNITFQSCLENGYTDRKKSLSVKASNGRPCTSIEKIYNRYKKYKMEIIIYNSDKLLENDIRIATQTEIERLMTIPDGYTKILTRNKAVTCLGNGWTVDVISHIFKELDK